MMDRTSPLPSESSTVAQALDVSTLSKVEEVEKVMNAAAEGPDFVKLELPVKHIFSEGLYARELFIPAGTLLTGKIHKYKQLNILSSGRISVLMEDGMKEVSAPFSVVSPAGTKRIAFAHTDCVWTTILATEERDPEKIEDFFTCASSEEYRRFLIESTAQLLLPLSN